MHLDSSDKFWRHVQKTDACWLWTGSKNNRGYGQFGFRNRPGGRRYAHRVSWAMHYGPIPPGLWVLHTCDTPSCIRPEHLFLGTNADNMADAAAKGRTAQGERHGSAKLTQAEVAQIRQDAVMGESQSSIGHRFGVGQVQISRILSGHRWRQGMARPSPINDVA